MQEALKLQQDMRKKKQEMLKTQIECQKVRLVFMIPFFPFYHFTVPYHACPFLPGVNQPPGEESRDETRGEGQHHEDPEGADRENHTAAE